MTEPLNLKKKTTAKDILTRKPKKKVDGPYVAFIPKDGELTVQFLSEPFEWLPCFQVWTGSNYVTLEHDDDAWDEIEEEYGKKPSVRFLAPALDPKEAKVIVVQLTSGLAKDLLEFGTRKDADITSFTFELYKTGEGLETRYKFDSERSAVDIARFQDQLPDLEAVLDRLVNPPSEDELADDAIADDAPAPKRKLSLKK